MKRGMMMLLLVLGLRMPAEAAGTRLASVYLESINALQAQVFQAAQVFEAPELGSAPMMMGMLIPGFAQLDRDAAIGLHIYAGGEQHVGFVMALKPAVAPELFLGGLLARQGLSVPEPVDGRYSTSNGVAQMQGDLLLIARNAADLDLAMEAGLPVALPDIPGFLRLDLAPGRLADLIGELEGLALKAMADAPAQADAMRQGFDLYRRGLAQVAKVQHGISVTGEGLVFRSRLMPQPGRALEGILASLQPADPQWVAALEGDHMFGVVAGAYKVPEDVMRNLLEAYLAWMAAMTAEAPGFAWDTDFMRSMFAPSLATVGAPTFFFGGLGTNGTFQMHGGMRMAEAEAFLERMVALTTTEAYQKQMASSGMKVSEPVTREVAGQTVYRWDIALDEEAFLAQLREAGAPDMESKDLAAYRKMMNVFWSGYDYAAMPEGLAFGMGPADQVAKAIPLLADGEGTGPSALLARIGAPVAPYLVARFDLLGTLQMIRELGAIPLPAMDGQGQGVVMAGWRTDTGIEQATLIPAADIRMLKTAIQSAQ